MTNKKTELSDLNSSFLADCNAFEKLLLDKINPVDEIKERTIEAIQCELEDVQEKICILNYEIIHKLKGINVESLKKDASPLEEIFGYVEKLKVLEKKINQLNKLLVNLNKDK